MVTTSGTFSIDLSPAEPEVDGTVGRFEFTKVWQGGLRGDGSGVMLSAGDPTTGRAGYVALERVVGSLDGRTGSFALQQFGHMADGDAHLTYLVVPGSATGELAGLRGTLELDTSQGDHRWRLVYDLA